LSTQPLLPQVSLEPAPAPKSLGGFEASQHQLIDGIIHKQPNG